MNIFVKISDTNSNILFIQNGLFLLSCMVHDKVASMKYSFQIGNNIDPHHPTRNSNLLTILNTLSFIGCKLLLAIEFSHILSSLVLVIHIELYCNQIIDSAVALYFVWCHTSAHSIPPINFSADSRSKNSIKKIQYI